MHKEARPGTSGIGRLAAGDDYGKRPVVAPVDTGQGGGTHPRSDTNTLTRFLEANVKNGSQVSAGGHGEYTDPLENLRRRPVTHSTREYVRSVGPYQERPLRPSMEGARAEAVECPPSPHPRSDPQMIQAGKLGMGATTPRRRRLGTVGGILPAE